MKQSMLTVVGKDQSGIVANVTKVLFKEGCNLEDVSMTILEGQFAMILIMSRAESKVPKIKKNLQAFTDARKLSFFWKDLKSVAKRGNKHERGSTSYLISAVSKDKTGIVYKTSNLLATLKLNITDLNSHIVGKGKKSIYALLLEVDIPKNYRLNRLEKSLKALGKKMRIDYQVKKMESLVL